MTNRSIVQGEQATRDYALTEPVEKGMVAFVGESKGLEIMVSDDLIRKGLTVIGSWHWNLNDTRKIMDTIAGNKSLIANLVTHKFPLSEAEEAFNYRFPETAEKFCCIRFLIK